MDAVVLVGGLGTRLRPLTLTQPKQMLPLGERPMIEHVVARLARYGIDRAVLSMGYRPDVFRDAYPDSHCAGVELIYAVDPEPLDTAGAVRYAARAAGVDSTFVAVNGDVITTYDLGAQLELHRERGGLGTLHLYPVDDPSRFGVVPTDDAGRVLGFVEKPAREEAPSNWINAGGYVLEPEVLDLIDEGPVSIERVTFPALAEAGQLFGYKEEAYWVDAGTPESYLAVILDRLDGLWGETLGPVAPGAVVDPTATVDHAYVAAGAEVGAEARVADSVILDGAVIGPGASVQGSIVGPGAVIGERARVSALSVVGAREQVNPHVELVGARVPPGAPERP